jgi:hypothetical protein
MLDGLDDGIAHLLDESSLAVVDQLKAQCRKAILQFAFGLLG